MLRLPPRAGVRASWLGVLDVGRRLVNWTGTGHLDVRVSLRDGGTFQVGLCSRYESVRLMGVDTTHNTQLSNVKTIFPPGNMRCYW